jgi:tRNA pseudouridine55 synthase
MSLDGLLILNKPTGITSRQAVDVVARLARPARVGHAGTLDPLASGVLVVAVGAATRWIEYVQRMPKHYVGTFFLGRQSPTEDVEGDVTELPHAPIPTREQIAAVACRLVGRIQQRPPAFSALKVAGQRAYQLARRGQQPQLAARPVEIHRIEIAGYDYPELVLRVACGSGTYIRSLGRDLAELLGTAAVMSGLVRMAIGAFRIEDAVAPNALRADDWQRRLLPPLRAVGYLPRIQLSADEVVRLRNGLSIAARAEGGGKWAEGTPPEIVAIGPTGELIGILSPSGEGKLRTLRNMPTP